MCRAPELPPEAQLCAPLAFAGVIEIALPLLRGLHSGVIIGLHAMQQFEGVAVGVVPKAAAGTVVTLIATPASGSPWVGWSGAVTSKAQTITVTVNSNLSLTANFK